MSTAYQKGYNQGYRTNDYVNPYPIGTEAWEDFLSGHDVGLEDKSIEKGNFYD